MRFAAAILCVAALPAFSQEKESDKLAPYYPTPPSIVQKMLEVAGLKPGEKMFDLGSGDGRIVIMAASKFKLDNLIAIVDQNGYQQTGATKDVLDLKPLAPKFEAFGWSAQEIDGNDMAQAVAALGKAVGAKGKPSVIIARTAKGFPIQHLLGSDPNHHGKPFNQAEAEKALAFVEQN